MPSRGKLTAEAKREVIRLAAEFWKLADMRRHLKDEHGITISSSGLSSFIQKHTEDIRVAREALLHNLGDLPIASKFWRLQQLQDLFNKENRYRLVRYAKRDADGDGNEYDPIEEIPLGELRQLLNQAALELGELREGVDKGSGDVIHHRVVVDTPEGERAVPASTAGLSDAGSDERGKG